MRIIRQTKNSANSFWSNRLYRNTAEESSPTVTTDDADFGNSLNCEADGTVVSQGTGDLINYGFVWAEHDNPTVADNVEIVGTGSFTGAFSQNIFGLPFPATVYIAAYATNSHGTGYGTVLSGATNLCLAAGTKIATKYGYKNIEDISYEDDCSVWNFDEGRFDYARPIWMIRPFKSRSHAVVEFSNGTELKTVNDGRGHRIFNLESNCFTHMFSEETPIGTTTWTAEQEKIQVVSKRVVTEKTVFYNIITNRHLNTFANDILTSTGLNNIYPIRDMKFIKSPRSLFSNDYGVSDEIFAGFRLAEQPSNNLHRKINHLMQRQAVFA